MRKEPRPKGGAGFEFRRKRCSASNFENSIRLSSLTTSPRKANKTITTGDHCSSRPKPRGSRKSPTHSRPESGRFCNFEWKTPAYFPSAKCKANGMRKTKQNWDPPIPTSLHGGGYRNELSGTKEAVLPVSRMEAQLRGVGREAAGPARDRV